MDKKNIIIIILVVLLVVAISYICLSKPKTVIKEIVKDCEPTTQTTSEKPQLTKCEIDMQGKTKLNATEICGEDFFINWGRELVIKNVKIDNHTSNVRYVVEEAELEEGIVQIYRDDTLFAVHKAVYANSVKNVEIIDKALALEEYSFTDIPNTTNYYDIFGLSTRKDAIKFFE